LNRGARLVELLKQAQYTPFQVERQIVMIFAGTHGYLDRLPVEKIRTYEESFLQFLDTKHSDVLKNIQTSGKIDDQTKAKLEAALKEFDGTFEA
jgi:F-type H+-transporting ATPase subunit alpha